jgi:hypothetical protein
MKLRTSFLAVSALVLLLISGCMGTFETARVTKFRAGATYFGTAESEDDDSWSMPGIFLEGGFPAGPSRFGLGLHIKVAASVGDDDGFIGVLGAKLQFPENGLADIAVGVDLWGILPGEARLHISREVGVFEPYICVAAVDFLDYDDDDDGSIDIFSGQGLISFTAGTMLELGQGARWKMAAEIETGEVWEAPGFGAGIFREF